MSNEWLAVTIVAPPGKKTSSGTLAPSIISMSGAKSQLVANFDVGVLFYNRARQTLDCILSFLGDDIQPSIVILDQGSAAEQRKFLTDALSDRPNVRFITLDRNIGVGPGRNRLSHECSSDWVLFIDNDTTLNTPGGVGLIDSAVGQVEDIDGYSPKILNVHENLFTRRLQITGEDQSLRLEEVGSSVTITNMFSGCAVVLRRSFLLNEPYDERYFVGFEDFELALRAFACGKPMRLKNLENVTLVHKHMPVVGDADVESTKVRYSFPLLADSFGVLKNRFNKDLFSGWERWTSNQKKEMIVSRKIEPRPVGEKINLIFVADAPGLASGDMARDLGRHIDGACVLSTVYSRTIDNPAQTLRMIVDSHPDVIHFMWRADFQKYVCADVVEKCAALMRLTVSDLLDLLCQSHITFSVGDYLFLDQEEIGLFRPLYWLGDGYCVTSSRLFEIYRKVSDYPKPSALILDGLDAAPETGRTAQWQRFFEGVMRTAHPDARHWRRFMIDRFFISADNP
jgi:glycosyltransferase involved in cell wall biosynthesis